MLPDLHAGLAQLLYVQGKIPEDDVDVRFEAPRRDWVASLTRPTVDLFLFDVRENTELRQANLQAARTSGSNTYRVPPRRFDLRYMVTALTTVPEDEHMLLWRTLVTLIKYPELPENLIPASIRGLEPPVVTQIKKPEETSELTDLWSGLEEKPHPALLYVVTVPLDLDLEVTAPLVLTRTARYQRVTDPGRPLDLYTHIGGRVADRHGKRVSGVAVSLAGRARDAVVTDTRGQFTLPDIPHGRVTLRVTPPGGSERTMEVDVPSDSYDLIID
jgi:hypothetical protein